VLAAPAVIWVVFLFLVPFYVLLSVAFGGIDPILLSPVPEYAPWAWRFAAFRDVLGGLLTPGSIGQEALGRTFAYVGAATALCLAAGYPFAYFLARHAGRFRTVFLVAFTAPFWISYVMRLLAWVSLLQEDGYVNRALEMLRVIDGPVAWLEGKWFTVVLGLVYGYVPLMVLALFASLDRIDRAALEAAQDLGAGRVATFLRVTLPLSKPAIVAGSLLVALPMFGDYYTQHILAATRQTSMLGNLIVSSLDSSLVNQGASLVLVMLAVLLIPMLSYMRSAERASREVLGG